MSPSRSGAYAVDFCARARWATRAPRPWSSWRAADVDAGAADVLALDHHDLQPARASAIARGLPDWPVPMMTASYAEAFIFLRGNGMSRMQPSIIAACAEPPRCQPSFLQPQQTLRMRAARPAGQKALGREPAWADARTHPPADFEPRQLPNAKSRGARLLVRYCVQCHNLPNPAMHNAAKWPGISSAWWCA